MVAVDEPLVRWDWLGSHTDVLVERTVEHTLLTLVAFGAGLLIASVLASIARRWRWTNGPITTDPNDPVLLTVNVPSSTSSTRSFLAWAR